MKRIKVINISDNIRSKTLIGNIYIVKRITECGMVITKCNRFFYEGEYEDYVGIK